MITSIDSDFVRKYNPRDNIYYEGPWIHIKHNKGISNRTKEERKRKYIRNNSKESNMSVKELYNYHNNKYLIDSIKRYRRMNKIYDENIDSEPFPIYMEDMKYETGGTMTCKGCLRHYLSKYNYVNNNICKFCLNLPIPSYPLINSIPCLVEKTPITKVIIEQTLSKSHTAPNISKKLNNENIQLKYFEKEYIESVIKNRLRLSLTQEQFARRINYSSNIIKDFESGKLLYDNKLKNIIDTYFN